jgi:hypothetical protein
MRALKIYFLRRSLREQVALVLFIVLAAAMWLSNFGRRAGRFWTEQHNTTSELAVQKQWLANRAAIEVGAQAAVQNLDPSRTLDDTRLVAELSALAGEYNLKFTNDTPRTLRSAQFAVHTVQFTLPRADWDVLKRFYLALAKRSPYIGIEQVALAADRANPSLLNATLRVSSVEVLR